MAKKKLGYNWKARQQNGSNKEVLDRRKSSICDVASEGSWRSGNNALDTNIDVLPPKKSKVDKKEDDVTVLKRKLSGKQRKRLQKVLEVKRKKAQRLVTLESLTSYSLPDSHLSLLHSSAQLRKSKKSHRVILNDLRLRDHLRALSKSKKQTGSVTDDTDDEDATVSDVASLVGTSWKSQVENGGGADEFSSDSDGILESRQCQVEAEEEEEDVPLSRAEGKCQVKVEEEVKVETEEEVKVETVDVPLSRAEGNRTEGGMKGAEEAYAKQPSSSAAKFIQLPRDPDIQCARLALPILSEEQVVMEAIAEHPVVVVCGETGSGKTTQVPQFLYEAGYAQRGVAGGRSLIGITEPRRVAAVSMAGRVGMEMGVADTGKVAYQIRYEGNSTADTEIKFMTDGVLLKEVEQDFLLSQYSVVIIDEAHERSVYTDILIGLLSRIVPLREKNGNPLKLVIMSATLRVEDFTENSLLFPRPPPIIRVESRQFPVTIHFNRRTAEDYVDAAYRKTCKIHRTLQPGGVLVFVTGQKEVHTLCRMLSRRFPANVVRDIRAAATTSSSSTGDIPGDSDGPDCDRVNLDSYSVVPAHHTAASVPLLVAEDEEDIGVEEDEDNLDSSSGEMEEEEEEFHDSQLPMRVLPLYSLLSPAQQRKVFESPPPGVRLCVVATNVAETSLTIPSIKYVVDTGKVKRRFYDKVTGISTFRVCWSSKSSANQRAGRAGRTEPGHCYRLYSSALFHNVFEEFSPPEITRRPVDDLVLQMKAMNIDRVANFPFPTPPSLEAINAAQKRLHKLGALEVASQPRAGHTSKYPSYSVTPLGRTMATFPLAPPYAKMLALGQQHGCLPYVIALVSTLSVRDVFVTGGEGEGKGEESEVLRTDRWTKLHRSWVGKGESLLLGDLMALLRAVGAWEFSGSPEDFCRRSGLRHKAMVEVRKLRQQLTNIVNVSLPGDGVVLESRMPPLSQDQVKYIRQIVLAGLGDHVAHKVATQGLSVEDKKKLCHAYQCTLCEEVVHLPSSSVLYYENPEFVVFQEVTETTKLFMRGVCAVDPAWFPHVLPEYCTFHDPLDDPPPAINDATGCVQCHVTCTYGIQNWPIGTHRLPYPKSLILYKLFAMFLLQGKVLPDFRRFSPFLLVAPVALVKKWSKLHSQCEVLVAALANGEVASREALLVAWEKDPKYLLGAYSQWLPESRHKELFSSWPLKSF